MKGLMRGGGCGERGVSPMSESRRARSVGGGGRGLVGEGGGRSLSSGKRSPCESEWISLPRRPGSNDVQYRGTP